MRSCVEVHERIELSFGMTSGVGPGIDVLDSGPRASRGAVSGIFRHLHPIGLNGQNDVFFAEKCIQLMCEKLTIFPYGQNIVRNVALLVV